MLRLLPTSPKGSSPSASELELEHARLKQRLVFVNHFNTTFRSITDKNYNQRPTREVIHAVHQIRDLLDEYVADREKYGEDNNNSIATSNDSPRKFSSNSAPESKIAERGKRGFFVSRFVKSLTVDCSNLDDLVMEAVSELKPKLEVTTEQNPGAPNNLSSFDFLRQLKSLRPPLSQPPTPLAPNSSSPRNLSPKHRQYIKAEDNKGSLDVVMRYTLKAEIGQMKHTIEKWQSDAPSMLYQLINLCSILDAQLSLATEEAERLQKNPASAQSRLPSEDSSIFPSSLSTVDSIATSPGSVGCESTCSYGACLSSPNAEAQVGVRLRVSWSLPNPEMKL